MSAQGAGWLHVPSPWLGGRSLSAVGARLLHLSILDARLRLLLMLMLALPAILFGALLHMLVAQKRVTTSLYLIYGLLFRVPGVGTIRADEPWLGALVLNVTFLFSTFVFAILLGLISEDVKGHIKAMRSGERPLALTGHVLLLNFSQEAVPVLRQLVAVRGGGHVLGNSMSGSSSHRSGGAAGAARGRGVPIVLMTESGRADLARVVADVLKPADCEWHLRTGKATRTDDLQKVCAGQASIVILLKPSADASSSSSPSAYLPLHLQALTCLAVVGQSQCRDNTARSRFSVSAKRQNVVVQVSLPTPPGSIIEAFQSIAAAEFRHMQVHEMADLGMVDRLVAQSALQPGVSTVLSRIFGTSAGSAGPYFTWLTWPGPVVHLKAASSSRGPQLAAAAGGGFSVSPWSSGGSGASKAVAGCSTAADGYVHSNMGDTNVQKSDREGILASTLRGMGWSGLRRRRPKQVHTQDDDGLEQGVGAGCMSHLYHGPVQAGSASEGVGASGGNRVIKGSGYQSHLAVGGGPKSSRYRTAPLQRSASGGLAGKDAPEEAIAQTGIDRGIVPQSLQEDKNTAVLSQTDSGSGNEHTVGHAVGQQLNTCEEDVEEAQCPENEYAPFAVTSDQPPIVPQRSKGMAQSYRHARFASGQAVSRSAGSAVLSQRPAPDVESRLLQGTGSVRVSAGAGPSRVGPPWGVVEGLPGAGRPRVHSTEEGEGLERGRGRLRQGGPVPFSAARRALEALASGTAQSDTHSGNIITSQFTATGAEGRPPSPTAQLPSAVLSAAAQALHASVSLGGLAWPSSPCNSNSNKSNHNNTTSHPAHGQASKQHHRYASSASDGDKLSTLPPLSANDGNSGSLCSSHAGDRKEDGAGGLAVCGFLCAATGNLRLNPKESTLVFPGDRLLVLVRLPTRDAAEAHAVSIFHHLPLLGSMLSAMQRVGSTLKGMKRAVQQVPKVIGEPKSLSTKGSSPQQQQQQQQVTRALLQQQGSIALSPFRQQGRHGAAAGAMQQAANHPSQPAAASASEDRATSKATVPATHEDALSAALRGFGHSIKAGVENPSMSADLTDGPAATTTRAAAAVAVNLAANAASSSSAAAAPTNHQLSRANTAPASSSPPAAANPQHVVVICRKPEFAADVLDGLHEFAPPGSSATLLVQQAGSSSSSHSVSFSTGSALGPRVGRVASTKPTALPMAPLSAQHDAAHTACVSAADAFYRQGTSVSTAHGAGAATSQVGSTLLVAARQENTSLHAAPASRSLSYGTGMAGSAPCKDILGVFGGTPQETAKTVPGFAPAGVSAAATAAAAVTTGAKSGAPNLQGSTGTANAVHVLQSVDVVIAEQWPVSPSDLVVAGLGRSDAVVVPRDPQLAPSDADALVLSTLLQLQHCLTDPNWAQLLEQERQASLETAACDSLLVEAMSAPVPAVQAVHTDHACGQDSQEPIILSDKACTASDGAGDKGAVQPPQQAGHSTPFGYQQLACGAAAEGPSPSMSSTVYAVQQEGILPHHDHPPQQKAGLEAGTCTAVQASLSHDQHAASCAAVQSATAAAAAAFARATAFISAKRRLHVVGTVHSTRTRAAAYAFLGSLAAKALTLELLVPEELSAALLARVAHDPAIAALLAALLATTQGMEVYLADPSCLGLPVVPHAQHAAPYAQHGASMRMDATRVLRAGSELHAHGQPHARMHGHGHGQAAVQTYGSISGSASLQMAWPRISDAARSRGATALGLTRNDGSLLLVPDRHRPLTLQAGDRVVLLAQDPL